MPSSKGSDSAPDTPFSPKSVYKDPDDGRQRFLLELEFIQCLANPTYIHYLAQNRYFEDEAFIGYLNYLQYWQRPEYIKFIMYPHCLYFLELLQNANFRNAMAHPANKELAHRQQFFFWKNYRNNRLKHILPRPLPEPAPAAPASAPPPPVQPIPPAPPTSIGVPAEKERKKVNLTSGHLEATGQINLLRVSAPEVIVATRVKVESPLHRLTVV
ncbi:Mediator of RNA polymerase II transcription subunit 31 [Euphorbia peplus]|nr:Mediator of RNA polymerase II transcription subunit 31 [Euphorbia peplus]